MNVGAGLIVSVLYGTAGIIILLVGIILGIVFTAVREQYTEDV